MNTRLKKYQLQKLKSQNQQHRNKQLAFNNRFNILDGKKPYDALEDPHASYYFVSKSVRNHLKNIKAAAINQTTNSLEKQRLKKLLNEKIKLKNKFFFNDSAFLNINQLITSQALRKTSMRTVQSQRKRNPQKNIQTNNKHDSTKNLKHKKLNGKKQRLKKRQFGHLSQYFNQSTINQPAYEHKQLEKLQFRYEKQAITQRRYISTKQNSSRNRRDLALRKRKNMTIRQQGQRIQRQEGNERGKKIKQDIHEKKHLNFMKFIEEKKKLILKAKQNKLFESLTRQQNKKSQQENQSIGQ